MRLSAPIPLVIATLVWVSGCATTTLDGDRHFEEGDLVPAESSYRDYLTSGRAEGYQEARARYRLGVIYALPDSGVYDLERARTAFEAVIESHPQSGYALAAALRLDLWSDRDRLARELDAKQSRAEFLIGELGKLQDEANLANEEVEKRQERIDELQGAIARLGAEIAHLETNLATREQELDRIKEIDLETPP